MNSRFPAAGGLSEGRGYLHRAALQRRQLCFDVASGEQSLFTSGKILDEVSAYLRSVFCGAFYGNVRIVEKEREEISLDELPADDGEEYVQTTRFFPVCNFRRLDGADAVPKYAAYIADCGSEENDDLTLCGAITYLQERAYTKKNEKTGEEVEKVRFSLTVSDGTGSHARHLFSQKGHSGKNPRAEGGRLGGAQRRERGLQRQCFLYGEKDQLRYRARKFVPEPRKGNAVPAVYRTVFPEPYVDYTQAGFFDRLEKPTTSKIIPSSFSTSKPRA